MKRRALCAWSCFSQYQSPLLCWQVLGSHLNPLCFPEKVLSESGLPETRWFLRKAPMAYAGIADTIWIAQGEIIKWSNARFRTVVPGLFLVSEDCSIDGSRYGRVFYLSRTDYYRGSGKWETFRFSKRDTIEYLQYRAEGSAFLRMDGVVINAELGTPESAALREIRSPQLELWIEVEDKDGKPIGWFRLEDDYVQLQTRAIMFPSPEFLHSQ